MAVESRHPDYQRHIRDWEACRDVYEGQGAVKARENGRRYLPPTTGMWLDGMDREDQQGYRNYCAYRDRALLSGFVSDCIDFLMGMLWHRPHSFELGPLETHFGDEKPATEDGQTLEQLLRSIHLEQLQVGRCGIIGDLPKRDPTQPVAPPAPYIELYTTERIINWDDGARQLARRMLNLVVLDECGPVRKANLEWETKERYRVLALGTLDGNESDGVYRMAEQDKAGALDPSLLVAPDVRGQALKELPFVFINAKSTTTRVGQPPVLPLVEEVLALYRLDADYRLSLHLNVGDTLMTRAAEDGEVTSVGPGAHINIKNPKGDAKFIGQSGSGLAEMRQAVENSQARCARKAGEMLADNSKQRESGEAVALSTGRKGTKLIDIALSAAEGLQRLLRILARWLGASDAEANKIAVTPNKEWASLEFATKSLKELVEVYVLGGPITLKSIHDYNVRRGYTTMTWEELIAEKRSEKELLEDLLPMPAPKPGDDSEDEDDSEGQAA